jgi:HEAT repeats
MRAPRRAGAVTAGLVRRLLLRDVARPLTLAAALLAAAACASKPPPPVAPPPPTFDDKMAAILYLEDRRTLSDASVTPAPVSALPALLTDSEGRVRRRAALAMGRTGMADAVAPLTAALAGDTEPEVRAMAAFALGLLGDAAASRLRDSRPAVRRRPDRRPDRAPRRLRDAARSPAPR